MLQMWGNNKIAMCPLPVKSQLGHKTSGSSETSFSTTEESSISSDPSPSPTQSCRKVLVRCYSDGPFGRLCNEVPTMTRPPSRSRCLCPRTKRGITWGSVQVQSYPLIPGDHPDCLVGPALTIDWEPMSKCSCSVESFEDKRSKSRRSGEDSLRISHYQRRRLLKRSGFEDKDIFRAEKSSQVARRQRGTTLRCLTHRARLIEFRQRIFRSIGRTKKSFATSGRC